MSVFLDMRFLTETVPRHVDGHSIIYLIVRLPKPHDDHICLLVVFLCRSNLIASLLIIWLIDLTSVHPRRTVSEI